MFSVKDKNNTKLILAIFFLAVLFLASPARAASLYFSPASGNFELGSNIAVGVLVSSPDQPMNASQADIEFSVDRLQITSVSTKNSIYSLLVENPVFSNQSGSLNFSGIILNPGFTGNAGRLITINFMAKALGQAKLRITGGEVLANDGAGTNILNRLGTATLNIVSPTKEKTEPAAPQTTGEQWYPIGSSSLNIPSTVTTTPSPTLSTSSATTGNKIFPTTTVKVLFAIKIGSKVIDSRSLGLLLIIILMGTCAIIAGYSFWESIILHRHLQRIHKHNHFGGHK